LNQFDFEMDSNDYHSRYPNAKFHENLLRSSLDIREFINMKNEMVIFDAIIDVMLEQGSNIIIIDNLTKLVNDDFSKGDVAKRVMNGLLSLKEAGATVLILAHTPKIAEGQPITKNNMAGSKKLSDLADTMFAIGKVTSDNFKRYIIQTKSRGGEIHAKDNVLVVQIAGINDFLRFEKCNLDKEKNLLLSPEEMDQMQEKQQQVNDIKDCVNNNMTQSAIASQLGISQGQVAKIINKHGIKKNK
jgi:predicted XRE-type DNA-binding protein